MANTIVIIDDEPWISIDLSENINWSELGLSLIHIFW